MPWLLNCVMHPPLTYSIGSFFGELLCKAGLYDQWEKTVLLFILCNFVYFPSWFLLLFLFKFLNLWQTVARASWQQPKRLCKLVSSMGYCPTSCKPTAGDQHARLWGAPHCCRMSLRDHRWHSASSGHLEAMCLPRLQDALGEKTRPRVWYTQLLFLWLQSRRLKHY